MNSNTQSLQEIVNFLSEIGYNMTIDIFQKLNGDGLLNTYMNCFIYLKFVNNNKDFELNSEEENLFATVVRDNRALKILKVTALINHVFKKFGINPTFSPIDIFSPNEKVTISTFLNIIEINKMIKEYIAIYRHLTEGYLLKISEKQALIQKLEEIKNKNNDLNKALEESSILYNEIIISIEKYIKQIEELSPLAEKNKEEINKFISEFEEKIIHKVKAEKQIEEKTEILQKLKENVVLYPEKINKMIEENKSKLNNLEIQKNNLFKEIDSMNKITEIFSKINEKCAKLKENMREHKEYSKKIMTLKEEIVQNHKDISTLEKELIEWKEKYNKNSQLLKKVESDYKNAQKEYNSLKSKLTSLKEDNKKIRDDLKLTLEYINNDLLKNKSEIDKIRTEKKEIENIREEFAEILEMKFRDIDKRKNIYFRYFDKCLELYNNYQIEQIQDVQK